MITIKLDAKRVDKPILSPNKLFEPLLYDWLIDINLKGLKSYLDNDYMVIKVPRHMFSRYFFEFCMSKGIEVYGYRPYVRIKDSDLESQVPRGLPNSEGNTWKTWRTNEELFPIVSKDGYSYFVSNSFGPDLHYTNLNTLNNTEGVKLIDPKYLSKK